MSHRIHPYCLPFVLFTVIGCQSPTAPPEPGYSSGEALELDRAVILDPDLQDRSSLGTELRVRMVVEATGSTRSSSGTVSAWTRVRNVTDFPLYIQVRTQFFDASSNAVEGPTPWENVFLPARSLETYSALSTKREGIAHYYIEIRRGR